MSTFNPLKCKLMVVTRKKCPANPSILTLGTHAIARVHQFTYLGVTVTADLSWDAHIHALCTKVRKILGLLYRTFYANASASSLLKLYISLIRPSLEYAETLEYACQVWNPHLFKDIEKLEKVQKFALRLCVKQWDLGYSSLLFICCTLKILQTLHYVHNCQSFDALSAICLYPKNNPFPTHFRPFVFSAVLPNQLVPQLFCSCSDWNLLYTPICKIL